MVATVRRNGFTFVELIVALAVFSVAAVALLRVSIHSQRVGRVEADVADLQQRLRVTAEMMQRDLQMAGAGPLHGRDVGPLVNYFAPIIPARTGLRAPDPALAAFPDRISLVYVPDGGWQASLLADMPTSSADIPVNPAGPGCPTAGLCGFTDATRAAILDTESLGSGADLFAVTGITAGLAHGAPNAPFSRSYNRATAVVVPIAQRVYYLDRANRRLMVYDGHQSDMPLIDNVVDLDIAYYADSSPSSVARPEGPLSNCAYDAGPPLVPLLLDLGPASVRRLTPDQLMDGPVCGLGPYQFDGDLLRIRRVAVTLRLRAGIDGLRDYEVTFDATPRNMVPTR
jgi:prepilin-type N-terminal cleavage/methylation domain-containing protein